MDAARLASDSITPVSWECVYVTVLADVGVRVTKETPRHICAVFDTVILADNDKSFPHSTWECGHNGCAGTMGVRVQEADAGVRVTT